MAIVDIAPEVVQDIEKGSLSEEERETLVEFGFLVQNDEADKQEMLGYIDDLNSGAETFDAVVVLNLDCNLGCKYCFEGARKGKFFMSAETADRFVDFVTSCNLKGKNEISILFYGGEPLLSIDTVVRISDKLRAVAESKKMKYSFSFITNGTLLTKRIVEKLIPLGLAFASVTLDGPKEVHDAFRPFKTGKGSFDVIVDNIRNVCQLIDIQIGGNYTKENYREFPRLLDFLLETGLTPDKICQVRFDPVVNESAEFAPPDFHDGCMSTNEPWLFDANIFLREEILKRGFSTQELMPAVCMVERRNSLVVNFDGTLYKCPGLIGRKDYCVGSLKSGLIDYRESHCVGNWKNDECLACEYLPLCFGGCRYMKLLQDGTMNGVLCRKDYFDRTLEAFVRQDVKYGL
jgi:uncharacterized protein